jgi:hypothetical protein
VDKARSKQSSRLSAVHVNGVFMEQMYAPG